MVFIPGLSPLSEHPSRVNRISTYDNSPSATKGKWLVQEPVNNRKSVSTGLFHWWRIRVNCCERTQEIQMQRTIILDARTPDFLLLSIQDSTPVTGCFSALGDQIWITRGGNLLGRIFGNLSFGFWAGVWEFGSCLLTGELELVGLLLVELIRVGPGDSENCWLS